MEMRRHERLHPRTKTLASRTVSSGCSHARREIDGAVGVAAHRAGPLPIVGAVGVVRSVVVVVRELGRVALLAWLQRVVATGGRAPRGVEGAVGGARQRPSGQVPEVSTIHLAIGLRRGALDVVPDGQAEVGAIAELHAVGSATPLPQLEQPAVSN